MLRLDYSSISSLFQIRSPLWPKWMNVSLFWCNKCDPSLQLRVTTTEAFISTASPVPLCLNGTEQCLLRLRWRSHTGTNTAAKVDFQQTSETFRFNWFLPLISGTAIDEIASHAVEMDDTDLCNLLTKRLSIRSLAVDWPIYSLAFNILPALCFFYVTLQASVQLSSHPDLSLLLISRQTLNLRRDCRVCCVSTLHSYSICFSFT